MRARGFTLKTLIHPHKTDITLGNVSLKRYKWLRKVGFLISDVSKNSHFWGEKNTKIHKMCQKVKNLGWSGLYSIKYKWARSRLLFFEEIEPLGGVTSIKEFFDSGAITLGGCRHHFILHKTVWSFLRLSDIRKRVCKIIAVCGNILKKFSYNFQKIEFYGATRRNFFCLPQNKWGFMYYLVHITWVIIFSGM